MVSYCLYYFTQTSVCHGSFNANVCYIFKVRAQRAEILNRLMF